MKSQKLIFCILILVLVSAFASHQLHSESVTPDGALEMLKEGNQRFSSNKLEHKNQKLTRVMETKEKQKPFAAILACSDSRVGPEIIFDQGIGDLFVIRLAGNILTPQALGSIEYATKELGTPLVVVLGHSHCGAVSATIKGGKLPGSIGTITKEIKPAIKHAKCAIRKEVDCAAQANASYVAKSLKERSAIINEQIKNKKVKVISAFFDFDTGKVEILEK